MPSSKRPRVAAIGLDTVEIQSIAPLCGELRSANSVARYRRGYSWTETDIVVARDLNGDQLSHHASLLTVGPMSMNWSDMRPDGLDWHSSSTNINNTERELTVPPDCAEGYLTLALELRRQLASTVSPPFVARTSRQEGGALIDTTSGRAVALRLVLPGVSRSGYSEPGHPIALLLPEGADFAASFRAFLADVHKSDPASVPVPPPRLSQPSDWHTPEERDLAGQIVEVDAELVRLQTRRDELGVELGAAGQRAEEGVRRVLWLDGDELATATSEILGDLGFTVRDMDVELEPGEQRREDLRLTLGEAAGWEAIVEVKGYTNGTKTSDSRQVREQRERYIKEETRAPDLTLWLCNPHREMDPSSRPRPDANVQEAAENIGAVHVLTTDLYKQWALVAAGSLDAEVVVQSLKDADPGLWTPPGADAGR